MINLGIDLKNAAKIQEIKRLRPLRRSSRVRYPDFTIADHASGVTYYWEHLGMLDDPAYRARWERKRAEYLAAGMTPHDEGGGTEGTLIETRDDAGGGLDAAKIARVIDGVILS
ncbi:MAG: hypothetical protein HYY28_01735 [Betaproteobacteria bacterium]|nr:hypothetical protein [Betaproteobacteria bacterium]MBI2959008.1 hypothetical protein [Betaproteobacteria bacterium]